MTERADRADNPGVIAPPPLLYAGALALGLGLHWALGGAASLGLAVLPRVLGTLLLAGGVAIGLAGVLAFRRAGTNPEPWLPSTTVVARGIYARTRNPMYLGMTLAFIGLALIANSVPPLVLLLPLLLAVRYGVIAREERYLTRKFGQAYRDYTGRVRRWA